MKKTTLVIGISQLFLFTPSLTSADLSKRQNSTYYGKSFFITTGIYRFNYGEKEDYHFQRKISPLVGIEFETRYENGFAIGIAYNYFENKIGKTDINKVVKMNAQLLVFPLKYYFSTPTAFSPLIGIGLGNGKGRVTDPDHSYSDFITQLQVGFAYQWQNREIQVNYQAYVARLHESGPSICIFDCGGNLDISGRTLIVNYLIRFQ